MTENERDNRRLAGGAAAWLLGVGVLQPGWAESFLLLAVLVLVPLGMPMLGTASLCGLAARLLMLPAALLLLGAFALQQSLGAALLTLPWLLVAVFLALDGCIRLRRGDCRSIADLGMLAARIFPSVGAGWLLLARAGLRPLGFSDLIVLATAVHFHYAGFALPVVAARVALRLRTRLADLVVIAVIGGVPLVALGITLSAFHIRAVEGPAAWFLAGACAVLAVLQWRVAGRLRTPARLLLYLSSVSLLLGMSLAVVYALGCFLDREWLTLPQMLWTHAALNAVGFAVPGLWGWSIEEEAESGSPDQPAFAGRLPA